MRCARILLLFSLLTLLAACQDRKESVLPNIYLLNHGQWTPSLVLNFPEEVAPLDEVGKPPAKPPALEPAIEGEWIWQDASRLMFAPRYQTFQPGTRIKIGLQGVRLREGVGLRNDNLAYQTPPLKLVRQECRFRDILEAPMRRVFEAQLDFNYPLFAPAGTAKLGGNVEPPLGSSYGTRILISTQPLARPPSDTGMGFTLNAGEFSLLGRDHDFRYGAGPKTPLAQGMECQLPVLRSAWDKIEEQPAKPPTVTGFNLDLQEGQLRVRLEGKELIESAKKTTAGQEAKSGITLAPAVEGRWVYGESETGADLAFTPANPEALKPGTLYTVTLSAAAFPNLVFENPSYEETHKTPPMSASVQDFKLYSDPVEPKVKRLTATLAFTYPPRKDQLAAKVSVDWHQHPKISQAHPLEFELAYDDKNPRLAYLKTVPIQIPDAPSRAWVHLGGGLVSSLGGEPAAGVSSGSLDIPSAKDFFKITEAHAETVIKPDGDIERLVLLTTTTPVNVPQSLAEAAEGYVLPDCHSENPDRPALCERKSVEEWESADQVDDETVKSSTPFKLTWRDPNQDDKTLQYLTFTAPEKRQVFVKIKPGIESVDGFKLAKDARFLFTLGENQKELKILHDGALLSLTGSKKLGVAVRGVDKVEVTLQRVLPHNMHHLAQFTRGDYQKPDFKLPIEHFAETFTYEEAMPPGKAMQRQYFAVDFARFAQKQGYPPRGLFLLSVAEKKAKPEADENPCGTEDAADTDGAANAEDNPEAGEPQDGCEESVTAEQQAEEGQGEAEASAEGEEEAASEEDGSASKDRRLVLLTDMGLLVKTAADGHQDVFVMSFRSGQPVAGAQVSLLGMNGIPLSSAKTDAQGRVVFPSAQGLKDEKQPSVYIAEKDGDLSFLPYSRDNRLLDVSRFDVDGLRDASDSLHAFLFSDRGIYRPGDTAHIGLILRKRDWSALPAGLPLKAVITDPEDQEVWQQTIAFGKEGFEEIAWASPEAGKTGTYRVELFLSQPADKEAKKKAEKKSLGATSIRVEEFQPDRLQVKTEILGAPATGWLNPEAAKAKVTVRNLFGTAAAGNPAKLELTVRPWLGRVKGFEDYHFRGSLGEGIPDIPQDLGEVETNEAGEAGFDLPLGAINEPIYEMAVAGEGFEKGSGRSVVSIATGLVSRNAFLLGQAADGPLDYIGKGTARKLKLLALGPDFKPKAVETVSAQVFERRYVSTLVKREDGLYAYQSVARDEPRKSENFALAQGRAELALPTENPGRFFVVFKDAKGVELNRVDYSVAGEGNVTRDIERNAELNLTLDKKEYEPGESIQLQIIAPYEGAGLITIEQDGVVASQWFKATGTSSTHRITLPKGVSGNAYLQVAFVRSLDSREIYMSPLSYGVASFAISRKAYTDEVTLTVPDKVQPGQNLEVRYRVKEPTRLVLYAVDEGILQFAHYRNPAPLDFFFRKRALQTKTHQILDLILPDYALVQKLSAPGGDADEETFGKYKNPFARKHKAPLAFWSGLVQAEPGEHKLSIPVPDYFNGSIRVLAVAASAGKLAVSASQSVASNPFVIQPQQPYTVAPGDEFDMGVLVANATGEEGEKKLEVSVEAGAALELTSPNPQTLTLGPGKDGTVRFKAKAREKLGAVNVRYQVSGAGRQAAYSEELGIRPSQPLLTTLQNGVLRIVDQQAGKTAKLDFQRTVFDEQRFAGFSVSMTPVAFLRGIAEYLKNYPYGCTEQVVSQAFPSVVLGSNLELGLKPEDAARQFQRTLKILQARQKFDGSFAYWSIAGSVQPLYSFYATHWLLEARERGMNVPDGLLERAMKYADQYTQERHYEWHDREAHAYALYLLARNGQVVTDRLKAFEAEVGNGWVAGGYWANWTRFFLGAAFKLHHLDADADRYFGEFHRQWKQTGQLPWNLQNQPDAMSLYLYLVNKHFPDLIDTQDPAFGRYLLELGQDLVKKRSSSFQSSWSMLGLGSLWERFAKEEGKSYGVKAGQPLAPLELEGKTVKRAELARTASPVEVRGEGVFNLYYQLTERGYDKSAPDKEINQLLTVNRWLLNEKGDKIGELSLQDKLHIRLVLHPDRPMENIAVVMLIPGGFEIDLGEEGLASRKSLPIQDKPLWEPDYIDVQEDRVVFFGNLEGGEKYFEFRLKPLNTGIYTVPPVFAEGMYDTDILHRGLAGSVRVKE